MNVKNEILAISNSIDQLVPSLQVIGVFDLFEPTYWLGEGEQLGRILVICLYFKHYPEKFTPPLCKQLSDLKEGITSSYLIEKLGFG